MVPPSGPSIENDRTKTRTRRSRPVRLFEESCIRKAVGERGLNSGPVGLADATSEDEAASRWADCAFAYGDEWPDPKPADAMGGLFGLTERCSRWRVDVAMRSAGTATEGVPIPPPEGGRSRIRVWHHGNTDRDATSSYVIRSYPMSGTVRDLLRPPRAGSTVGVPRPRSSGPHHTGDRPGSGSP